MLPVELCAPLLAVGRHESRPRVAGAALVWGSVRELGRAQAGGAGRVLPTCRVGLDQLESGGDLGVGSVALRAMQQLPQCRAEETRQKAQEG